jgi:peroxiredoxin
LANAQTGDEAPGFVYYDSSGEKIKLSKFIDKEPVVLSFFATYCKPCRKEIPFLIKEAQKGNHFRLLLIATDTGNELAIKKFLSEIKVNYPYIFDPQSRIIKDYEVKDLPLTVYIGKSGKIIFIEHGFEESKEKEYQAKLNSLKEK